MHHSISDIFKIRTLIIGGGVVSTELAKLLQNVNTNCYATYGMTETVSHIAVKKLNNKSLREGTTKQFLYETLPNICISTDSRNCLVINAPELVESQIATNDIVELVSATEFKWIGRYDNIINSGGVKLVPEQIEEKLSRIIYQRFFVAGIPDEILGHKLVLLIEGIGKLDVIMNEIKSLSTLTKYELPKEVYVVPKFIETETKKIQRKKTLDLLKFR